MYATIRASLASQALRSARPRPLPSRWRARTPGTLAARPRAVAHVSSVEALSTIVIRHESGKHSLR